jgi:hypothetical protein
VPGDAPSIIPIIIDQIRQRRSPLGHVDIIVIFLASTPPLLVALVLILRVLFTVAIFIFPPGAASVGFILSASALAVLSNTPFAALLVFFGVLLAVAVVLWWGFAFAVLSGWGLAMWMEMGDDEIAGGELDEDGGR